MPGERGARRGLGKGGRQGRGRRPSRGRPSKPSRRWMPDRRENVVQGRCPTCSQLVTLSVEASLLFVQCPRCRHEAMGSVFVDTETPVPVILAFGAAQAPRASAAPVSNAVRPGPSATNGARSDEERTHLIINPVLDVDDEGSAERHSAHVASQALGVAKSAAADEARTHLLLNSADLQDAEETLPTATLARLSRLTEHALRLSLWLDELMHGRWSVALASLALVCGLVPPLLDSLSADPVSTLNLVASVVWFSGLATFGIARINGLRNDDGGWDLSIVGTRIWTSSSLLVEDLKEFARSPRHLQLVLTGQVLAVLGLTGLTLVSWRSFVRLVFGWNDPPSVLRLLSGLMILSAVGLIWQAARGASVATAPEGLAKSVTAAAKLPALVDFSQPLPAAFIGGHTPLHQVLIALSQWRARQWPDQAAYRAALERHFQRHLPGCRIERERWLGRSRKDGLTDIVIDDMVLIEVRHGFRTTSADGAIEQMRTHARTWPGKPMILAVFDASREAVFESDVTPALVDLHQRFPMLTARMPTPPW